MPSPFPGMDPYIEAQGRWRDFHSGCITYFRDALNAAMPRDYSAGIEERVRIVRAGWEPRSIVPDVVVTSGQGTGLERPGGGAAVAVLDAVAVEYAVDEYEERQDYLQIVHLPEQRLVTVLELLSPSNKLGAGRAEYLDKRNDLVAQPGVNLVEFDLLLGGHRLPMGAGMPRGDYFAIVGRADRRNRADVFAWSIRRPLPKVPIPLLAPDPDVMLDLAEVAATAYDRGRYARLLDYAKPLELPLDPADREWAEGLVKAALQ